MCALKYVANHKRSDYRLAIVVSKKVHKSAVVRNRIRRRLYEAFRLQVTEPKPYDMVVTVFHESLATLPAEDVQIMVAAQLKQANIL